MSVTTEILAAADRVADKALADLDALRRAVNADVVRIINDLPVDEEGNILARAELRNLTTVRSQVIAAMEERGARIAITIAERAAAEAGEEAASILRSVLRASDPLFDPSFMPDISTTIQRLLSGQLRDVADLFFANSDLMRRALLVGVTTGIKLDELAAEMSKRVNVAFHQAMAAIETAVISAGRAVVAEGVEKANEHAQANLFVLRYVGPLDRKTRPFCRAILTGVRCYTVDAVKMLDNGTDLPVLQCCGGIRCRHQWAAVLLSEVRRRGWRVIGA